MTYTKLNRTLMLPACLLAIFTAASAQSQPLTQNDQTNGWEATGTQNGNSTSISEIAAPTSGEALMAECLERLPQEPLRMEGRLIMRRPKGLVSKEFKFRVDLDWGANPPLARYTLSDVKGTQIETIIARGGDQPELLRMLGADGAPGESPQWNDRVQGSDVTWLDVTLAFLWWKSPTIVGSETIKGRLCDIVDIIPPVAVPNCSRMRIWLDRELKLLMQAIEINESEGINRKMWVRAVKKNGQQWMVRDLEVQGSGTGHRTRLHIESLTPAAD